MDTNCTMNHEIVPKSINWLQPAQDVSAYHKAIINTQKMQNTQNMQNMYLGSPGGAKASSEPFHHHQSQAGLSLLLADGQLCSAA